MSNRSNVTARTALTNLILSRCSVGRGRPLLRDSTQRSVGKLSEEAVAPAEKKEANRNHDDENVTNDDAMKEKGAKEGFEDDTNFLEDKETEILMKSELLEGIQLLNNAKGSLELLREIYVKRNKEKIGGTENLDFSSMKKLYGEKIVEKGRLAEKLRKVKTEVKPLQMSNDKLRRELEQMRGSRVQDNPFVGVGVPYGYHGTGGRDRPGRERSRARF